MVSPNCQSDLVATHPGTGGYRWYRNITPCPSPLDPSGESTPKWTQPWREGTGKDTRSCEHPEGRLAPPARKTSLRGGPLRARLTVQKPDGHWEATCSICARYIYCFGRSFAWFRANSGTTRCPPQTRRAPSLAVNTTGGTCACPPEPTMADRSHRVSRLSVHPRYAPRESVFTSAPELYRSDNAVCSPFLRECVLAMEDGCEEVGFI